MPIGDIQDSLMCTFLGMKVLMDRKVLMIEEWPWGPDLRIVGETKMSTKSDEQYPIQFEREIEFRPSSTYSAGMRITKRKGMDWEFYSWDMAPNGGDGLLKKKAALQLLDSYPEHGDYNIIQNALKEYSDPEDIPNIYADFGA